MKRIVKAGKAEEEKLKAKAPEITNQSDKPVVKRPKPVKVEKPAWADKYSVSLDINATFEIPQIGAVIKPKDLSLEQAALCLAKGCDWIIAR
jgi:hypothetical protein